MGNLWHKYHKSALIDLKHKVKRIINLYEMWIAFTTIKHFENGVVIGWHQSTLVFARTLLSTIVTVVEPLAQVQKNYWLHLFVVHKCNFNKLRWSNAGHFQNISTLKPGFKMFRCQRKPWLLSCTWLTKMQEKWCSFA